jgi:hypothetical protein
MQGGLGARKERLEKEAELARREQELTRREAAVDAERNLSKALGGASVTSKKQTRGVPKNKGGAQPNAFQQEHWPGTNAGPLRGPTGTSQPRSRVNNPFYPDLPEEENAGVNNDLEEDVPEIEVPRQRKCTLDDDDVSDKEEEAEGDGPAINFGSEGSGKGSGRPNSFGSSNPSSGGIHSNRLPLRQPPVGAIVRAGSQSGGTGVSSKGTWLQQLVEGGKGCFVADELEEEALQGIYVPVAPHDLVLAHDLQCRSVWG